MSKAGSMRGLSLSEPTRMSTSAIDASRVPGLASLSSVSRFPFPVSRCFDDGVVLAPLLGEVARVRDEALHVGGRHPPRRACRGDDVLFHRQRPEVVRAEA